MTEAKKPASAPSSKEEKSHSTTTHQPSGQRQHEQSAPSKEQQHSAGSAKKEQQHK